jgi:hypothetical protein
VFRANKLCIPASSVCLLLLQEVHGCGSMGHFGVKKMEATTLAATGRSSLIVILAVEAAMAGAPTMGLAGEPGAEATAVAEATRTATPPELHVAASMPARGLKNFGARTPPRQATTTASPPSLHGFAIYCSQRNSSLWGSPSTTQSRIQCSGSGAMPSPSRTLVATMTRSASTSPSVWTKPRLHGSSHSRSTRSTSGTS